VSAGAPPLLGHRRRCAAPARAPRRRSTPAISTTSSPAPLRVC